MSVAARRRPIFRICVAALVFCLIGAGVLAVVWIGAGPLLRRQLLVTASGLRARVVDAGFRIYDPFGEEAAVSCNCSSDWAYRCSDPSSSYMQAVRQDPRLAPLFDAPPHRLETYARYKDFLRDQFEHGQPSNPSRPRYAILDRLDEAAAGSRFLCDEIARMFVELVQADGGYARIVSIVDAHGSGHVVAEAWLADPGKWVVFDPDYDVYYTDRDGTPLSALELHEIHRSGRYDAAVAHVGASANAVYRPERHEFLLRHYDSLAFERRADYDTRYPLWHPKRHAVNDVSAWATGHAAFPALAVHDVVADASQLYFTPCREGQPAAAAPPR